MDTPLLSEKKYPASCFGQVFDSMQRVVDGIEGTDALQRQSLRAFGYQVWIPTIMSPIHMENVIPTRNISEFLDTTDFAPGCGDKD